VGDPGARSLSFGSRFHSDRRAAGAHAHRAARADAAIRAVPRGGYARPVVTDLERLIDTLVAEQVDFVIIGGVALVLHGSPRITQDLDICYGRTPENLERLAAVLRPYHPTLRGAPRDLPFQLDARSLTSGLNFTLESELHLRLQLIAASGARSMAGDAHIPGVCCSIAASDTPAKGRGLSSGCRAQEGEHCRSRILNGEAQESLDKAGSLGVAEAIGPAGGGSPKAPRPEGAPGGAPAGGAPPEAFRRSGWCGGRLRPALAWGCGSPAALRAAWR
jgi:hypothetical protein